MTELWYPPVGTCIYCGATDDLTDEHIVPLALGGLHVLPKSSCADCQKITSRDERFVARDMFGAYRHKNKIQSRRPNKNHEFPATIRDPLHSRRSENLPLEHHPGLMILPAFTPPKVMLGEVALGESFGEGRLYPYMQPYDQNAAKTALGFKKSEQIASRIIFSEHTFARVLAKIGHATAVAEFTLSGFDPVLSDVILDKYANIHDFVGGELEAPIPWKEGKAVYDIQCRIHWIDLSPILFIQIRLFSELPTPIYFVVAGIAKESTVNRIEKLPAFSWAKARGT